MDAEKDTPKIERVGSSRRRLVYVGLLVLLVAGGVIAFVNARPIYHWVKAKQAASRAQVARELIAAEKWREAATALREASQLSPREPQVLRTMAEFYSFADLRKQRQMLYALYENGDHTGEDLRNLILLELRFREVAKAAELSSVLLASFGEDVDNLKTAVRVANVQGDVLQAEGYLRRLTAIDPEDGEARLQLAQALLESSFREKIRIGWDEIYRLAAEENDVGLEALRLIVRRRSYFPARLIEIQNLVKKHPSATESDILAALGWRYESLTSRSERSEILEQAIEEYGGKSHQDNRPFYFWLNLNLEHDRVLELLPREEAYSTPGLLTVYMTALIQAEKFDALRAILEAEDELEDSSEVAFIKAQCALYLEMGTSQVRQYLQESFELALLDKRTEMLAHIAKRADVQGLTKFAETVYEAMSRIPETSLQAYEQLLKYHQRRADLAGMRAIMREVREKVPHEAFVVKRAAYLDLLQGVNMESAFEDIQELSSRLPSDEECNLILSFANYRLGDTASALRVLERCQVENLTPSYRAIYATILGAGGDTLGAVVIAEKLPISLLLNEEVQLVNRFLP